MDIKILVVTHKKYRMPDDDVYFPVQVGSEGCAKLGYARDNTGDNIAGKNPSYCELTALYWAWKNMRCDVIGLCHYRRYFAHSAFAPNRECKTASILGREDYEALLQKQDIILPKKRHYYIETVRSQYEHAHLGHDLDAAQKVIEERCPEYAGAFASVMSRSSLHLYNMFVMRKEQADRYCEWLFPILFELEERIDISHYSRQQGRVFGFLGERLFNVWLERQHFNAVEVPVVNLESVNWPKKLAFFLGRKVLGGSRDE